MRDGDLNASIKVVSNDEIGVMGEGFNRMTDGLKERDAIKDTFGRYLSQDIVNEILKSPGGIDLEGQLRDITILVSDLRGFTSMTDVTEPRLVLKVLNRYLERMTEIIIRHQGTIDEFTGDGILVFFGAPRVLPDHAQRAVKCALEMQDSMAGLNGENNRSGLPKLEMGIAINSGELIVGNIGSEKRKKYGAIGTPINIAFRVESLSTARDVLITAPVYERLTENVKIADKREVNLKGIDHPMTIYQVLGMQADTV
jgi:adenylate cyclase